MGQFISLLELIMLLICISEQEPDELNVAQAGPAVSVRPAQNFRVFTSGNKVRRGGTQSVQ